jgi:hypothetical protein
MPTGSFFAVYLAASKTIVPTGIHRQKKDRAG